MRRHCAVLVFPFLLILAACSGQGAEGADEDETEGAHAKDRKRAARIAAALDDRLLAAQVLLCGVDGRDRPGPEMRALLAECPAGGILLFRYNLDAENSAIQNLVAECTDIISAQTAAGEETAAWRNIPPFAAVDHEGGPVNRFRPGVAALPAPGSYWELAGREGRDRAIARVEADSFRAGAEIRALGINLNLAPVAEPLNAGNSDFLGDRSYGPDPAFAADAAAAFIRGMGRAGLLCCVKHFPGSAGPDPHRFLSVLDGGPAALDEITAPFAALVRGGYARAVMTAHSSVPVRDSEHIASLSAPVMEGWLRGELGFGGIIISDDFSMTAASGGGDLNPALAAARSLAAGADMTLAWPPDIRRTHRAILSALDEGTLSRNRLREAAARIIFEKIRMGLIDGE